MKTIILTKPGQLQLQETALQEDVAADEALLKVHRIGVCGTDMHAFNGKQPFFSYPRILGHELGVEVVKVGSAVTHVKPGDRCAVEPYFYTSDDYAVQRGKTNCAEKISVFGVHEDGGMREYITLPAKFLHPSGKLSYDQLALVETLGIGCHAVNRAEVKKEDTVLVIGSGPIGLATIQFAKVKGGKVVVMDMNESRLQFCQETMGVDGTINPTGGDVEQKLREAFDGHLPTVVFDATGNAQSMHNAFQYPDHGGKLVFIGLFQGDVSFNDPLFHKKELTLLASRNALSADFEEIIKLIEAGEIDTMPWITHRAPFAEVVNSFPDWLKPEHKVIKAMIEV
ncbi:zinc-binding alcohol dehydrogenase family protein [Pontibacter sp. E15-1]|uniref:zinc-binding alcohol dehydrogenase family protein n=1 Tax=Pontibacter sp. E15-1 TaxID=2919918 RepID=UPI001F4F5C50|nr:zinc-binding alcohol dehydrogenase family protein [Pontibacter sp. E15-1]MCJ8164328.1 zinc-binding alcohol dehydrogenase family protein [Pontibacter sp. E15-1]